MTTFSENATNPRRVMRRILGLAIAVSAMGRLAHAQSRDEGALAEQLFNQARDLAKANRWGEACPKFEASLRYDPVLGTRLNLATCYERIGKLATAWGLYRQSIELARKAGDVKRHEYARKQATALEPRLPKLKISVPVKLPAGFAVTRDGTPIDAGALGVALYIDPGAHEITASAPGFEAFAQTITLVEGKAATLTIPDMKAAPGSVPDPLKPSITDHRRTAEPVAMPSPTLRNVRTTGPVAAPSPTRKYVAMGIGGAGVVAVGVGFLFGARASASYSDAKERCGANLVCDAADQENANQAKQLVRDARSSATISTVLVAAGGAASVTGAIVFLTRPRTQERAIARIVPVTHDRGAGLALMGRF